MEEQSNTVISKRIGMYLGMVLGFYFICGIIVAILPKAAGQSVYSFLATIFTAIPLLATFITRKLTKDKSSWNLRLNVWKNWKMWIASAFLPVIAIFAGAIVFYCVFPSDLDFNGTYIIRNYASYGVPSELNLSIASMLKMGAILTVISAVAIPIQLLELGEEIGWRGYLLPLLCKKMSAKKATIINGILWGVAHAPLIYFGFNYGLDYIGAPYLGIIMMIIVCIVLGILTSYVTLKTGNCMYAAIIHGSVNVIGEMPIWVSLSSKSTLLGPNPTGILGMSVLVVGAIILFARIKDVNFAKSAMHINFKTEKSKIE